jgi:hypothetical protein
MGSHRFIDLDRSHNPEMLDILRSAPINADGIHICFDRQPDIFMLPEIKYRTYRFLGYVIDDRLSGFAMKGCYPALINGKPETVFHFSDYYILPEARGRLFNFRISDYLLEDGGREARIGYAVIMEGNEKALSLLGRRPARYPNLPWTHIINKLEVRTILVTWPLPRIRGYRIRRATEADIPDIVGMLNEEHRQRLFGLTWSEESFRTDLSLRPGLDIENYYLAEDRDGAVCGVCAAWDCTGFKQNRVLKYGDRFLPSKLAYQALAFLFGFAPLPKKGEHFRDLTITDYAVRDRNPQIMKALLRAVYTDCRKAGYQSLIWGSSADDPLLKAVKGFFSQPVVSNIVLMTTDPEMIREGAIDHHLPYIDLAFL